MLKSFHLFNHSLQQLPDHQKLLITTINAHCYNVSQKDEVYQEALINSDVLIPDGISVVWAIRFLYDQKVKKIAGADLFFYEMERLQRTGGKCFFLGSKMETLDQIKVRINREYPNIKVETYSPPYKPEFTEQTSRKMLDAVNAFQPDVLMVGMTAPKQEKWVYQHYNQLQVKHICCIGAVFDFYGGSVKRAPRWMIKSGLEWMYRLVKEPKRMWRRYLIGNLLFLGYIIKEKIQATN